MRPVSVLVGALFILLLVLVVGKLYISDAEYSRGNYDGQGMSQFFGDIDARPLYQLSDLSGMGAAGDLLVIVSPGYGYGPGDSAVIGAYLSRGGEVLVIDDFGEADSLLAGLDSAIRIRQIPLCQDDLNYSNPAYPIISNISRDGVIAAVGQVYTDHPAPLVAGEGAAILASTGKLAWLDYNRNATFDQGEKFGAYPLIASETYELGTLTVIADPDIFINGMIGRGDNKRLATALVSGKNVYVDESHGPHTPPLISAYYTIRYNVLAQVLCVLAILFTSFISYLMLERLGRKPAREGRVPAPANQAIGDFVGKRFPGRPDEKIEIQKKL
jgi:hypothetical protein